MAGRRARAAAFVAVALACCAVAAQAKPPSRPGHACPTLISAQYERVAAFSIDGPAGSIEGLTPLFTPRAPLRLVAAQLALAHGAESVPSELLPPDGLVIVPGRPMNWTLWDGQPPEPVAVVHMVCEYEGGLMLHRPIGRSVRACALDTQVQRAAKSRKGTKPAARAGGKGAAAPAEAAPPPDEPQPPLRPVLSRAVFSCR